MKKDKCLFTILFLFLIGSFAFSQKQFPFIENKNQWDPKVLYKVEIPLGSLFVEKNCFTYALVNRQDIEHSQAHYPNQINESINSKTIHMHSYKMNFVGANEKTQVIAENPSPDYANYFIGKNKSKWASFVKKYEKIYYKNLYPNIDLKFYSGNNGLQYDFIVHPSGKQQDILMNFEGVDDIIVSGADIIIKTSVGTIMEQRPVAWQNINGEKKQVVCKYVKKGNNISFNFPSGYDNTKELIIDPVLVFSTYTGSTADNWGGTATYDHLGNAFTGGIVGGIGYPVNIGAFQTIFAGLWDVGIMKMSPDGTSRIWATYIGGSSSDLPHSLIADGYNNLLIFGTTGSSDFPTTANAFDTTFNGGEAITYDYSVTFANGSDIYIARLSEDGSQLLASTFIGGSGNDGLNFKQYMNSSIPVMMQGNDSLYYNYGDLARGEIMIDNLNDVYMGSCTFSNDFPVTPGAFQTTPGGKQDGVVFKMSGNLSQLLWSSYIGGNEDDAVYSVDVNSNGDLYASGGTVSHNFPTTIGTIHPNFQGGTTDGFVTHVKNNGSHLIKSTYWGSPEYDQAYFVKLDNNNNVFLGGQTKATGSTLIYNAVYASPNSGQFISKLNLSLDTIIWSTVYGTGIGRPNISPTAMTVDICGRIYMAGWGREWAGYGSGMDWNTIQGTKNMPVTPNGYQSVTDGQDFYIMVLSEDASVLEYGSYFGEQHNICPNGGYDHVDGGTSRFDKKGYIYQAVCASCGGCDNFPTFPSNVWSQTNNSNNCNNAVFKFSFYGDFAVANFIQPTDGLAPYTVSFVNTSIATNFIWDFGDSSDISTNINPTYTFQNPGIYSVKLIVSDLVTCNVTDTVVKTFYVYGNSVQYLPSVTIVQGDSIQIGIAPSPDPNTTYEWFPHSELSAKKVVSGTGIKSGSGIDAYRIPNPYASPSVSTTYLLEIHNGLMFDSLYQIVNVVPTEITNMSEENDNLIVSPNPFNEEINLKFKTEKNEKISIQIYNSTGLKLIRTFSGITNENIRINLENFAKGTYIIQAITKDKTFKKKITKQ